MHHQFRHPGPIVVPCGQIQIAEHFLAVSAQEMFGAVSRQLPQNLFTDGCHQIEFSCCSDEFAYLLLLVGV
jgi:hypothetical protein